MANIREVVDAGPSPNTPSVEELRESQRKGSTGTGFDRKHLMEPGSIFKFPAGRAVEYYLAGKLGLSKSHLSEVAKMVP